MRLDLDKRLVKLESLARDKFFDLLKAGNGPAEGFTQAYNEWAKAHAEAGRLADIVGRLDAIGKEAEADFEDEAEEEDNEDDLDFEDDEDDEDDDGEEMFCPHCSEFERHASTCPTLTGNK